MTSEPSLDRVARERDVALAEVDYLRERLGIADAASKMALRERDEARALLQSYHGWNTRDVDVIIETLTALEREPDVVFSVGVFWDAAEPRVLEREPRIVKAGELAHAIRVAMSVGERASKRAVKLRAAMERIASTAAFESDEMKARTAIAADDALKGDSDEP